MNTITYESKPAAQRSVKASRPRVGFLGLGWIGRNRMEAIARSGLVDIVALSDVAKNTVLEAARQVAPVATVDSFEDLQEFGLDGLLIATPSAMHAEQARRGLCHRPGGSSGGSCLVEPGVPKGNESHKSVVPSRKTLANRGRKRRRLCRGHPESGHGRNRPPGLFLEASRRMRCHYQRLIL